MSTNEQTLVVNSSSELQKLQTLHLLVCLAQLSRKVKHCWGPTEEELRNASGLSEADFNRALWDLLNCLKCVQHRYSQEGTAGPFAHRYEVPKNLVLKATWGEENNS